MPAPRSLSTLMALALTVSVTGGAFAQNYDNRPYTNQPPPPPSYGAPSYGQQPYGQQAYDQPSYNDRTSCDRGLFSGQNVGTVLGAAVGGLLGSQLGRGSGKTVATIAGVVGGGFLGNQVGAGMDRADQGCMAQTLDSAPPGRTVSWRNPDNGRDYHVTPRDEFRRHGERCRTVESEAYIDGRREVVTNVACRRHDGTWSFDN
jgi:surface antigen